jgi:ribosomal protein S18 acetylase RimI-like enzyme
VHPLLRRRGVGRTLISAIAAGWVRSDLERVHLTVCLTEYAGIFGLLSRFGFEHLAIEPNRYGEGRDEAVLVWSPDSFFDSPEARPAGPDGDVADSQSVRVDEGASRGFAAA